MIVPRLSSLPARRRRLFFSSFLVLLLSSGIALAQLQTGNIFGTVVDNTDAPLPGVTVTVTGVGAPHTFITDSEGRFRFLNLSPGDYAVRAELSGFGAVTRSQVNVNVGRNTELAVTLSPAMAETITVTGESPLLDVRRTGTGATVTQVELQEIPTARDPWVILQQVPGVLMDRINVGGNESGQQSTYVGKGASGDQATWNVDGVNITDMASMSSPNYYDFDAFEEMQATTGGTDPRIQTPGVQLNMVTKRGTNELNGSGRFYFTDGDWQNRASLPEDSGALFEPRNTSGYLVLGNEINSIEDYGLELGGPIVRDRLWLWGAYGENDIKSFVAQPVGEPRFPDDTVLENWNFKLNGQLLDNNSGVILWTLGDKIKTGRNVSTTRPPETSWNQDGPTEMWKFEDTHIFSPNFYLTGMVSMIESEFHFVPQGGNVQTWQDPGGVYHGSYYYYDTVRPQDNYRVDASSFFDTGSVGHELKFGFGYRETPTTSASFYPHNNSKTFLFDEEGNGGVALYRNGAANFEQDYTEIYVGDTMLVGNLTVQAGFRYDIQHGTGLASSVEANPIIPDLLPAAAFAGSDEMEWTSISPRLGATYALGTEKRTLLRAAYNRYADQMSGGDVARGTPFFYYQYLYYYFTDANGDKTAQRDEIDFDYGLVYAYLVDPDNPGGSVPLGRFGSDVDAPKTDEIILGFEREITPEFTFGVNYTWRKMSDFIWYRPEKTPGSGDFYTSADYELAGYLEPEPETGLSYRVPYYTLRDGLPDPKYFVVENRPDYEQNYNGIELNVTKRLSNRWMMRGNVSWNDWTQDVGPDAIIDPTASMRSDWSFGCFTCDGDTVVQGSGTGSGSKGGVYINSGWSYVLTGLVELPWKVNLGASVQGREGYPLPYFHRVTTDTTKQVLIHGSIEDSPRLDDIFQADLRLSREFRIQGVGLSVSVDAFNITDERTILQREHRLYTSATRRDPRANRIEETQSPQVYRVGARITF